MQTTTDHAEDLDHNEDEREANDTTTASGDTAADGTSADESAISYEINPTAVTGIIRGLASTIPAKGTMLLAIAKPSDDEVLVTIVPAKAENESESAIQLVVKGTPEEIDVQLVEALGHYVPARNIAVLSAAQIARNTAAAAKKAADAAKARTAASAPKTKTPSLTAKIEPKDAALRVVDGADAVQHVKPGVKATVAKGRYIVTVSKLGFDTKTQTVVVGDGPQEITVKLEQSEQVALFGGTPK